VRRLEPAGLLHRVRLARQLRREVRLLHRVLLQEHRPLEVLLRDLPREPRLQEARRLRPHREPVVAAQRSTPRCQSDSLLPR
jgi:hypothetical protein